MNPPRRKRENAERASAFDASYKLKIRIEHERRTIFEEAAGVLKYKRRKEEALKKLEKTKRTLTFKIKILWLTLRILVQWKSGVISTS